MSFSCRSFLACSCLLTDYLVNEDTPIAPALVPPAEEKEKKKSNFVFAPIPMVNPTTSSPGACLCSIPPVTHHSSSVASSGLLVTCAYIGESF